MSLHSILYRTQFLFFIYGQAPLPVVLQQRYSSPFHKSLRLLPSFVHIYLIYVCSVPCYVFMDFYNSLSNSSIDDVICDLYIICGIVLIVSSIVSPYTNHHKFMRLAELFIHIESELKQRLNITFDRKSFIRKYVSQVILIAGIAVICSIPKLLTLSTTTSDQIDIKLILFYLRYSKYIVMMHLLFYVELLGSFASCMRMFSVMQNVSYVDFAHIQRRRLSNNFLQLKLVHFNLCTATKLANDILGWTFVALTIQDFFDFTYMTFKIFHHLQIGYEYDSYIYSMY